MSLSLADVDGRSRINYSMKIDFPLQETLLMKDTLNAAGEALAFGFCEGIEHLCQQHVDVQHIDHPTIVYILGKKITCPHTHNDIFWFWITVFLPEVLHQNWSFSCLFQVFSLKYTFILFIYYLNLESRVVGIITVCLHCLSTFS